MEKEEVDLIVGLNGRIMIKRHVQGTWDKRGMIAGFNFSTPFPVDAVTGMMHDGHVMTIISRDKDGSHDVKFPKPISQGQSYEYDLNIIPKQDFIKKLGNLNIIEWPKEHLDRILFYNNADRIFFSSALTRITTDARNKYRVIKPSPIVQRLKSPIRGSRVIRIEWGVQPAINFNFTYTVQNTGSTPTRDFMLVTRLPPTTKFQESTILPPPGDQKIDDPDQNELHGIGIKRINPGEQKTITYQATIKPLGNQLLLTPEFGTDAEYHTILQPGKYGSDVTKGSTHWDIANPAIQSQVRELKQQSRDSSDYIRAAFEFVNTTMRYEINNKRDTASNALKLRSGDCSEYSDLFIALLRAAGIPAKLAIGWVIDLEDKSLGPHGWVEFFSPKHGWIQCDPTWGYLVGVSCQHVCRQREGLLHDQPNYQYKYQGNEGVKIEEKVQILSVV